MCKTSERQKNVFLVEMADKEKTNSGAKQLMAVMTKVDTKLDEIKTMLEEKAKADKINEIDMRDWRIEMETKISALVSGRKTTTSRPKKESAAGGDAESNPNPTPVGNKSYNTSMAYFKGEYSQNKDTFRAFFTADALEELDEHMKTISKKGEAKDKYEANYLWNKYVKKVKDEDADTDKPKADLREQFKREWDAFKSENGEKNVVPSKKE